MTDPTEQRRGHRAVEELDRGRRRLRSGARRGAVIMMKFVALTTKSLRHQNPRLDEPAHDRRHGHVRRLPVKWGTNTSHACVDGPDFDGHLVDYDDAMRRGVMYPQLRGRRPKKREEEARERGARLRRDRSCGCRSCRKGCVRLVPVCSATTVRAIKPRPVLDPPSALTRSRR